MVFRLFLLFLVVPALDLALLIEVGRRIGSPPTIGIVLVTGFLGAYLTKQQGFAILRRLRFDVGSGRVPADALIDGVLVLIGAVGLLAPGLITDTLGLSLLLPVTRERWRNWLKHRLEHWIQTGTLRFFRLR